MEFQGEPLEPLANLSEEGMEELIRDGPVDLPSSSSSHSSSSKRRKTNANPCKQCGVLNKYEPPSGHTKHGWCPNKQRFSDGAALNRMRDLEPEALDAEASAFLEHVQEGHHADVSRQLATRPELILMEVLAASKFDVARNPDSWRPKWQWSVLHEALRQCELSHCADDDAIKTLHALLAHCSLLKIDINKTIPRKSDTWSRAIHHSCWQGNQLAIGELIKLGGDLFTETRGGFLPIHMVCNMGAPAYPARETLVPWLVQKMVDQRAPTRERQNQQPTRQPVMDRLLTDIPEAFQAANRWDVAFLQRKAAQCLSGNAIAAPTPPPVVVDADACRPIIDYHDLDDPANSDSLFQ